MDSMAHWQLTIAVSCAFLLMAGGYIYERIGEAKDKRNPHPVDWWPSENANFTCSVRAMAPRPWLSSQVLASRQNFGGQCRILSQHLPVSALMIAPATAGVIRCCHRGLLRSE